MSYQEDTCHDLAGVEESNATEKISDNGHYKYCIKMVSKQENVNDFLFQSISFILDSSFMQSAHCWSPLLGLDATITH